MAGAPIAGDGIRLPDIIRCICNQIKPPVYEQGARPIDLALSSPWLKPVSGCVEEGLADVSAEQIAVRIGDELIHGGTQRDREVRERAEKGT
jgi:hypothetical protein